MECNEWFDAVEPALEETGSLLVDMSPALICVGR